MCTYVCDVAQLKLLSFSCSCISGLGCADSS